MDSKKDAGRDFGASDCSSARRDKISEHVCPECDSPLRWAVVGYDNFGSIKELQCSYCQWDESQEPDAD
jgi:hypothetical protein